MGYQTVKNVPTLRDYNEAKQWWERTKPIRGRSNDLRPLAERRYADCYSIRKDLDTNAIECVLYNTAVVTFTPDGEVHVRNNGWATASTHMFIEETLGTGLSVRGQRGRSIITSGGSVFSLGQGEVLRLRRNGTKYEIVNTQTHHDYKINRKATNIVRGRYKDFYDYFKGFVKLRGEETVTGYYSQTQMMVTCTFTEIADQLGTEDYWDDSYLTIPTSKWTAILEKPGTTNSSYRKATQGEYEQAVNAFFDLIRSDQPEETKHTNFHKAALILLTYGQRNMIEKKGDTHIKSFTFPANSAKTTLDTVLYKWFANEVLERYEVPKGKVPSNKYTSWVKEENNG